MEAWIELDASKAVIQRVVPELLDHSKQHYQEAFLSWSIGWKYHLGRRTWSTTSLAELRTRDPNRTASSYSTLQTNRSQHSAGMVNLVLYKMDSLWKARKSRVKSKMQAFKSDLECSHYCSDENSYS